VGALESDNSSQADRAPTPPRAPLVRAATFCWFATVIAITAAVYAYASTPRVANIPYEVSGQLTGLEGKLSYLLYPFLNVLVAPLIMSYYLITWKSFKHTMIKREKRWRGLVGDAYPLSMYDIVGKVHFGFCFWQVIVVSIILYRCVNLLSMT
jgi:hypothetical protein